jgi:hypothetical protein
MIHVTMKVTTNPMDSETKMECGEADLSEAVVAVFAAGVKSLWPTTLTQMAMAANRARKMSKLQPARRPSLPIKILRRVDGGAGAIGSGSVTVSSRFNGLPRVAKVRLSNGFVQGWPQSEEEEWSIFWTVGEKIAWLLKNSLARNLQKKDCIRKPYKRTFSAWLDIFYPQNFG